MGDKGGLDSLGGEYGMKQVWVRSGEAERTKHCHPSKEKHPSVF